MLADLDCAKLCQSLYDGEAIFDYVGAIEEVCFAYKSYPACNVVVFEGSHNIEDWKDNIDAVMIYPPGLNGAGVHQGFYLGLASVMAQIEIRFSKTKPIYVTGHSLGAARAHIFAAMLVVLGYNVITVAFGSPRPGNRKLAKILKAAVARSYWNYHCELEHDPVCKVPVRVRPCFLYVPGSPYTKITGRPDPVDMWGPLVAWHRLKYYIQALSR